MPLPENARTVQEIIAVLEPKVLGTELPAWSCCCGAVTGAAAIAAKIQPAGDECPGQETEWILWSVKMEPKPGEPNAPWSRSLSDFVSGEELNVLFAQYFGTDKRD